MEISVVVTTYQLQAYIGRCMDELLAQTFRDFEILAVDDASRDQTAEILTAYEKRYPEKIKVFRQTVNSGSSSHTRNFAIESGEIHGRYVLFLDGDDRIEPDFLQTLYENAEKHGAQISVCAYDRVDLESQKVLAKEMTSFPLLLKTDEQSNLLPFINTSLWNKLIRTELILKNRFPLFKIGEDMCFLWGVYADTETICFTDRVLIHYQVRSSSLISNTSEESIRQLADEMERLLASIPANRKEAFLLTVFLHVGLSMALRAAQNSKVVLKDHLKWTKAYLKKNGVFKGKRLRFFALAARGIKGLAIWGCKILYQTNLIRPVLSLYSWAEKKFGISVKF